MVLMRLSGMRVPGFTVYSAGLAASGAASWDMPKAATQIATVPSRKNIRISYNSLTSGGRIKLRPSANRQFQSRLAGLIQNPDPQLRIVGRVVGKPEVDLVETRGIGREPAIQNPHRVDRDAVQQHPGGCQVYQRRCVGRKLSIGGILLRLAHSGGIDDDHFEIGRASCR